MGIPPQAGLLKEIADGHIEVRTLVGEGQSPHSYEPTARQLAALGKSNALFTLGVPFEKTLLKKIEPLYPDLPIVATGQGIELRTMPHAHHGEPCSVGHGENDPHVWLTPLNALAIASNILQALELADPENADAYRSNYNQLKDKLETLDALFKNTLEPFKGSRFYVFHPSFGYFADAYGLRQVPIELEGKSPSPRQLANLIEQARAEGVKVVFVQKQFPASSANAVAQAIGGTVVQLDPLAEDVVANLRQIAESIIQALEK
ncbi:MAG: zinc ABC transporter substrate-binding protein [Verrucomicrobiota bacterium]|nr:zinc ABC transporter substrate-binding protein [Verrucomicrobiota bacterium]